MEWLVLTKPMGTISVVLGTVLTAFTMPTPLFASSAAAQAVSAADTPFVVDKDGAQCPEAGYQSIQAAVDAAPPGSVISVCPDLYTETVTVAKTVVLHARPARRLAQGCFESSASSPLVPSSDVIVSGGSVAFDLRADGIVVEGFVVHDNVTGIRAVDASRYVIRRNVIQNSNGGVVPGGGDSGSSVIRQNCFRDNTRTVAGPLGPIPGSAIVNLLAPRNVVIEHNHFFRNSFGARFGGAVNVTIEHNRSLGDGTWLRMGGTRNLRVQHNRIGQGPSEAMLFFPQGTTGAPNVNALVSHNVITDRGSDGLRAQAATGSLVDSVVSHNRVTNSGRDAIRIEAGGNAGNRIERNHLVDNGEHDCHDDTVGSGTALTANLWLKNKATTESRPGLCAAEK
jgi:hypothetical protein